MRNHLQAQTMKASRKTCTWRLFIGKASECQTLQFPSIFWNDTLMLVGSSFAAPQGRGLNINVILNNPYFEENIIISNP